MSFIKKPEFLNHQTFINYPVDDVCSLLKIDKQNFAGRNIHMIGSVVRSCEKVVYSLKKVWSELQIQFFYGMSRRDLKQDLCKRVTFMLRYFKSDSSNFEPAKSETESNRVQFGFSARQLRMVCNVKREMEVMKARIGFLVKPEKNNALHKQFSETQTNIHQRREFHIESLCRNIQNAAEGESDYFKEYLGNAVDFKVLSSQELDKINSCFYTSD